MTDFSQISTELRRMQTSLKSRISSVLYAESQSILSDLRDRSPVDSGFYRSNWKLSKSRFSGNNVIAGYTIGNKTAYGLYMDEGADPNSEPWYFPGKRKKKTGKLKISNGKVWAGGLNPGHEYTVGGQTGPVVTKNKARLDALASNIADAIVGGM
jgi:hypothetical protein